MRLRLHQISVDLDYEMDDVVAAVARRLGCRADDLGPIELRRRSIDARQRRHAPCFVLSVELDYRGSTPPQTAAGWVELVEPKTDEPARSRGTLLRSFRPVIVGAGPAGLLAALTLAEAGARPRLIERGDLVDERRNRVERFWKEGVLDAESNVLYGEGGAGLFSDGKLTARSKERGAVREFLEILVACGASREILIDAEPHLGTDALVEIIPALRRRILSLGGEIAHRTCLESIHQEDGRLRGVVFGGQEMETEACLLATGHSARDVYRMLAECQVLLEAKPFAMGVRVEMPQSSIDRAQFGRWAGHPRLGPASFRLTRSAEGNARDCYSFCMCPGGVVMACASSPGEITTNGMSDSRRRLPWGNAAFVVPVRPDDFADEDAEPALRGIVYQETVEREAFARGASTYAVPAQRLSDFLCAQATQQLPQERSCARAVPSDLSEILPAHVVHSLRKMLPAMLAELNGVRRSDVLLYGPETRTSSPVRVVRDPISRQSAAVEGLFVAGEGAGYAGGIVSSAIDGIATARAMVRSRMSR